MKARFVDRVTDTRAFTVLEILIGVLILVILMGAAFAVFFRQSDHAYDAKAQAQLEVGFKDMRSQYLIHEKDYPVNNPERLHRWIERSQSHMTVSPYAREDEDSWASSAYDISNTIEDEKMATLCSHSETGVYYCVRGDELGLLPVPDPKPRNSNVGRMVTKCSAWSEPDARDCLATRVLSAGTYSGPTQTGTPGWVPADELPDPAEDPDYTPPPVDPGDPGENPGGEEPGGETGGENPGGENPGGEDPGDDPTDPGDDPGEEPTDPGEDPGEEEPADPGEEPGGEDPGEDPTDPGEEPGGEDPGEEEPPAPAPTRYTLTVEVTGGGEVRGPGIQCPGDCSERYDAASEVTLSRVIPENRGFTGWSGACVGSAAQCQVVMSSDRLVRAEFNRDPYSALFEDAGIKALDWITVYSKAYIDSSVATNGNLLVSSNATVCGNAFYNGALTTHSNYRICGDTAKQPLSLPPVNQGDARTQNDNARLGNGQDPWGAGSNQWNVLWNSQARTLTLYSGGSITLGGGTYSLCRLELSSNTQLRILPGANVQIYFDDPASCGIPSWQSQLQLYSNSQITTTDGSQNSLQMLFVGNPSVSSSINLSSNTSLPGACSLRSMIYAPRTDIVLNSNSTFCGNMAGKTLRFDSNAYARAPQP